jgi:myo-inositol-1(or 4)-monophosphatase
MTALSDAEVAVAAATVGAAEVRRHYGRPVERHAKEGTDFATTADIESERAIRALITEHRPDDLVVGEEEGPSGPADAERDWLLDPLCGTRNFAAQTPLVAVNVALRSAGRSRAAASADPASGEVFWTDGQAAYVRRDGADTRLEPSATSLLLDLDLEHPDSGDTLRLISDHSVQRAFSLRGTATTLALTWVAAGRRAAYLYEGDVRDSVHFAAPIAIAQAAGCIVTGTHGQPVYSDAGGLLAAADAATHERLLEILTSQRGDTAGQPPGSPRSRAAPG